MEGTSRREGKREQGEMRVRKGTKGHGKRKLGEQEGEKGRREQGRRGEGKMVKGVRKK